MEARSSLPRRGRIVDRLPPDVLHEPISGWLGLPSACGRIDRCRPDRSSHCIGREPELFAQPCQGTHPEHADGARAAPHAARDLFMRE